MFGVVVVDLSALTVEAVSPDSLAALHPGGGAFQSSAAWWRAVAATAIPPGAESCFALVRHNSVPVLLLPLLRRAGHRCAQALTTPYTCLYQPAARAGCDLAEAAAALAPLLGPLLRIDGIDPAWPGWAGLQQGFRHAGRRTMAFTSFANWHENLQRRSWPAYLADRPGALRETIRRRLGQAERDPACRFSLADTPDDAARLLQDYAIVAAASWKPPEPHPGFAAAFTDAAARAGKLRIAVLRRNDRPIAAQYWTVEGGIATLHKLVYDVTARGLSPGTVLTAWMIRRLIEVEQVAELDFGRGDDPYKASWATQRRQRGGLIVANPRHPLGAAALLRQYASRLIRHA